jgi:hypothetical protein
MSLRKVQYDYWTNVTATSSLNRLTQPAAAWFAITCLIQANPGAVTFQEMVKATLFCANFTPRHEDKQDWPVLLHASLISAPYGRWLGWRPVLFNHTQTAPISSLIRGWLGATADQCALQMMENFVHLPAKELQFRDNPAHSLSYSGSLVAFLKRPKVFIFATQ